MTCVTSQFKEKNHCGPRYDISIFYVADAGKCFTILESSVSLKKNWTFMTHEKNPF